jgi:hypothetical protein
MTYLPVTCSGTAGTMSGTERVAQVLSVFFHLSEKQIVTSPVKQGSTVRGTAALLSLDGSAEALGFLKESGFRQIRTFAVLPSLEEPRWLLPEENASQAIAGLKLYTPFSLRTRVLKYLGTGIAATGFPGRSRSRVIVASREPLPIENLIRGLTNGVKPGFAISIGTRGTCQKLTVQAMSPSGEILAYIKMPMAQGAADRIQNEAKILEKLARYSWMRQRIPRLLCLTDLGADKILVQSPLAGKVGPTALTQSHEDFLRDLQACESAKCEGEAVVTEAENIWRRFASGLDSVWQELARAGFATASRWLAGKHLLCAPMHGDFVPWNSRADSEHLLCFDWESASWHAPIHWDKFHFLAQTHSLIKQGEGPASLSVTRNGGRASFILYLLYSAAQLAAENSPRETLEYRREILRQELSGERIEPPSVSGVLPGRSNLNWSQGLDD